MDKSLLVVREINHKYIVVDRRNEDERTANNEDKWNET